MDLEIIKLLTEDSAKLIRACSILLKLMFTYAVAAWLFKVTYGTYTLISLTDLEGLQHFVTSGLAFVCIFFALATGILLFYLLPLFTMFVFSLVEVNAIEDNKMDRNEQDLLKSSLKHFKILDIRNRGRKIILMKRADMMYEIAQSFSYKESRQEVARLKTDFISQIVHVYLVFCAYYLLLLDPKFSNWVLTTIIIAIAVSMVGLYRGLSKVLDLLYRSAALIVVTIEEGRLRLRAKELFIERGFYLTENLEDKLPYDFSFQFSSRKFGVSSLPKYERPKAIDLRSIDVKSMLKLARKNDMHLLVISRHLLTKEADELLQQHSNELTYLRVNDMADLETKLTDLISARFNTNPNTDDNQ